MSKRGYRLQHPHLPGILRRGKQRDVMNRSVFRVNNLIAIQQLDLQLEAVSCSSMAEPSGNRKPPRPYVPYRSSADAAQLWRCWPTVGGQLLQRSSGKVWVEKISLIAVERFRHGLPGCGVIASHRFLRGVFNLVAEPRSARSSSLRERLPPERYFRAARPLRNHADDLPGQTPPERAFIPRLPNGSRFPPRLRRQPRWFHSSKPATRPARYRV